MTSERTDRNDIATADDIRLLVDGFYGQVRVDPLIGGIFNGVIRDRWPEHLAKMYTFWGTVLLGEESYHGAPMRPHLDMPLHKEHFDRWIALFHATVDNHFQGPVAELAKMNGSRMAAMFLQRITFFREQRPRHIQ